MNEIGFEVDGHSWRVEQMTKTTEANRTSFLIVCSPYNTDDATALGAEKIAIGETILFNNHALSIVSIQIVYQTYKQIPTTLTILAFPPASVAKLRKQDEMKNRLPALMEKAAKHMED